MSGSQEGVDLELRAEYIDESLDGLSDIAQLLVDLETNPTNEKIIETIFRPVHSIKGSAAYFDLMKIKALSHEMETLLDLMRKSAVIPTPPIIDVLLRGIDELTAMLVRVRREEPETPDLETFDKLVQEIITAAEGDKANEEALWKKLLTELEQIPGALSDIAVQLAAFSRAGQNAAEMAKKGPDDDTKLPQQARQLNDIFSSQNCEFDTEKIQHLFDEAKNLTDCPKVHAASDEALSEIELFINSIGLDDPIAQESLRDKVDGLVRLGAWMTDKESSSSDDEPDEPAKDATEKSTDSKKTKVMGKTMRVPEKSIDTFLSYVGDLISLREMYHHLYARLSENKMSLEIVSELRRVNESFGNLSQSLQTSIMNIRKVPLNTILQRAPRIVRDIAGASEKQIKTRIKGKDIMADKSIIGALEAPLIHMTRNAADHGIEPPEIREANGKTSHGLIEITAVETAEQIILTIKDDGKGLDYEALAAKAISLGLIPEGSQMTEDDIVDLLFMSGVSTAENVTDISGRGVGMDVVKRNIEEMGGRITISSKQGKGSEFIIYLPKTVSTQIFTGFIVVAGENRYILPMDRISHCFRPEPGDISIIAGKGRCVHNKKEFIRISRLSEIFDHPVDAVKHPEDEVLIIVEAGKQSLVLAVDNIEGVKQVVLKEIKGINGNSDLFKGGALMGDGTVAMIVDIDRFAGIAA